MCHEKHQYITVGVTCCQCNPDFTIRGHRCDDVNLLTKDLIRSCIDHSTFLPSSLSEVSLWNPTFINVDDSFSRLVHLKHFLRIETTKDFATFRITLKRYSLDLSVRKSELLLQHFAYDMRRNRYSSCLLNHILKLLDRPNWLPLFNCFDHYRHYSSNLLSLLQLFHFSLCNRWL